MQIRQTQTHNKTNQNNIKVNNIKVKDFQNEITTTTTRYETSEAHQCVYCIYIECGATEVRHMASFSFP